ILQLKHLDADSAERAIRQPLEVYNAKYAAPGEAVSIEDALVKSILEQVETGSVTRSGMSTGGAGGTGEPGIVTPFLQLVMERLWTEEAGQGPRQLRRTTFDRLGGAAGIVTNYLDDVMNRLPGAERLICARMFVF